MRRALLLLVLAGCPSNSNTGYGSFCRGDSQCDDGDVCTRSGECDPPSELQSVRTTWTIAGEQATVTTCAPFPTFELYYSSDQYNTDLFGYSPVPCKQGSFFIDKLPARYTTVMIGSGSLSQTAAIDADGTVAFDLQP